MMVITGAGGGIMAAAHEGAGLDNSLGLNITLPFEQHANPTVDGTNNLLSFHFFFVRKLFFIKEADALVLCPGDRKSTRLNSSHVKISYAVFCLKKKTQKRV